MSKWARNERVTKTQSMGEHKVNLAIVGANNRYAWFGPGTANMVRKMIGLEESVWKDKT